MDNKLDSAKTAKLNGDDAYGFCLKIFSIIAIGVTAITIAGVLVFIYCFDGEYMGWFAGICVGLLFFSLEVVAPTILVKKFIRPLEKVVNASNELASGNFDVKTEYDGGISELATLFENFNKMASDLASISILRSDFVSNVSHEFKTPLATIEGYATLLQDPTATEEERNEYIDLLLTATRRLSSLVGDVLMMNKLENGGVEIKPVEFRLDEQINQVLLLQSGVWEKKGIRFELDIDETVYYGAQNLLERVWSNLISNAVKYSDDGGAVDISLKRRDGQVVFKIVDNGVGIAQKDIPHIFEKFYQADTRHKTEGNGLGLAQVYNIVKKLNGDISVESEEGSGSTFTVILPERYV